MFMQNPQAMQDLMHNNSMMLTSIANVNGSWRPDSCTNTSPTSTRMGSHHKVASFFVFSTRLARMKIPFGGDFTLINKGKA